MFSTIFQAKVIVPVIALATSAVASPSLLSARQSFSPTPDYPRSGTVWYIGQRHNVTWDTSGSDSDTTGVTAYISKGGVIDSSTALASNATASNGRVEITVPTVDPGSDYAIVLYGSSGSGVYGSEFTISNGSAPSSTSTSVASGTHTTVIVFPSTTITATVVGSSTVGSGGDPSSASGTSFASSALSSASSALSSASSSLSSSASASSGGVSNSASSALSSASSAFSSATGPLSSILSSASSALSSASASISSASASSSSSSSSSNAAGAVKGGENVKMGARNTESFSTYLTISRKITFDRLMHAFTSTEFPS